MKMLNSVNLRPLFFIFSAVCSLLFFTSCGEEVVKLNANDRSAIDSVSTREIAKLTTELDNQCKIKSDSMRKHFVDSLVVVREREIMMQTRPVH